MSEITISSTTIHRIMKTDLVDSKFQPNAMPFTEEYIFRELQILDKDTDWQMNIFINPNCTPVIVDLGYVEHKTQLIPDNDDPTLIVDCYRLTIKGRWAAFLYRIKCGFTAYANKNLFNILHPREYHTFSI